MPRQTFRSTFTRILCGILWVLIAVVAIGLLAEDPTGGRHRPTGASLAVDPSVAVLGVLPVGRPGSSPPPRP